MTAVKKREISPRVILAVVGFSVFVAADDLTVVSTMLRPIINDLGLILPDGLDDAAWIVNVYLIAFVAIMPIAGRISDVVGRRKMFAAAYSVFIVGSVVIALSDTLNVLFVGRVLTALGGGAMVPVAMAVVGDVFAPRERTRALGTLGAIETLGWVWGPLYGALLVHFLDWRWQFWLNVPLAIIGLALSWWALADFDAPPLGARVDWIGAALLTLVLVSLNVALLGGAEIQSVSGLEDLTGSKSDYTWLFAVSFVAAVAYVLQQQRSDHPLVDASLFRGRGLKMALIVNFIVGAALVIAMVDVPLFINAVEIDLKRSAVISGWVLASLTAAMAITSYAGGRIAEKRAFWIPIVLGLSGASGAYLVMGLTWTPDTSYLIAAAHLAVLGAGLGLVIAPTTSAVLESADVDERGSAAALVMVVRLMGLSVGLSALTAWGLARFNDLRSELELPPITDPGFQTALQTAQASITAEAIASTFLAIALITGIGALIALSMRRRNAPDSDSDSTTQGDGLMQTWLQRNLIFVLGGFAVVLLGAFVMILVLSSRLNDTQDDLARVESGAALFAAQVQGFQEQLTELGPLAGEGLDEAIAGLESFGSSTLDFDVSIDETVTIDTEIVLDRKLVVPIDETFNINDTFDTEIVVEGPLGLAVPLNVTIPVDIDVPIKLDLEVPVNETFPISAEVPVTLDVPLSIEIADTELAVLADSLAEGLKAFRDILDGLGA